MASAAEALGMTLPGSSSFPAESPEKLAECDSVGAAVYNLLEKNILPRDIMTRSAFENAMVRAFYSPQHIVRRFVIVYLCQVLTMILGGSTNAVLHLIAIAHSVGIKLELSDFQNVSDRVPFIADLKPSGKYVMEDVYKIGGIPSKCLRVSLNISVRFSRTAEVLAYLLKNNLIDGDNMTVTGRTLGENLERWTHEHGELSSNQDVIRPLDKPIKETGHIRSVPD